MLIEWKHSGRNVFELPCEDWLEPESHHVISPLKLKNIRVATERVMQAISENEKIDIFADP